MGIDARHPQYEANCHRWQRCRDAYDGEDAIKSRGDKYLPQPGGLDAGQYAAYVKRALYYGAVGRTIDGFVGAISRKDAVLEIPAKLEPVVEDATTDGLSLNEFGKLLCCEAILQGRGGVLVDFDTTLNRAFMSLYQAEQITNWYTDCIVLFETVYEADQKDTFKQVAVEQYRQLSLADGVYSVQLWRRAKNEANEWAPYGERIIPTRRGVKFDKIPFFWLTPIGKTSRIPKPPLLDLVDVALSHYRNSADLEHGRHFTGMPTLYVTGVAEDDEQPIRAGAMAVMRLPQVESKMAYAEFTGQGLKSLETALTDKQAMMAVLGASVFHDGPRGVEAAETARIRTSGETSLLSGVVTAVEETLKAALACAAEWMSTPGNVEVTLNREFIDTTMDGPTLQGLVLAYQAGALSLPQFLYNLQQGELLSPNTDLEEEAAVIEAAAQARADNAMKIAQSTKPKQEGDQE